MPCKEEENECIAFVNARHKVACKCLETTDGKPVPTSIRVGRLDGRGVDAGNEHVRPRDHRARRRPVVAVGAGIGLLAGGAIAVATGRIVACRGASTGTRGRVGEVARELSAVTELMTKITKNPSPKPRNGEKCERERLETTDTLSFRARRRIDRVDKGRTNRKIHPVTNSGRRNGPCGDCAGISNDAVGGDTIPSGRVVACRGAKSSPEKTKRLFNSLLNSLSTLNGRPAAPPVGAGRSRGCRALFSPPRGC